MTKIPNTKHVFKKFEFGIWNLEFVSDFGFRISSKRGITLLLVVILLSAILSISVGIFNVIFGEILISGEIADSFIAFYASDQGIERTLYRDRSEIGPICAQPCSSTETLTLASTACFERNITKASGVTTIKSTGQYRCGANPNRIVKRGFDITY